MEQVELAPGIFHLQSGSNVGLVVRDGRALVIDAGLDKDAARRIRRAAAGLDVTLQAVILTHAHADHFGGAAYLQQQAQVELYAPALEAAMMEHPILEPLYLFAGAAPIAELRGKFTLARPCDVDHVVSPGPLAIGPFEVEIIPLPGHAPNQVGVGVGEVLFCADAVFPQETLDKHKVLFCVDVDETLDTLEKLPGLAHAHFAPGHGPAYESGEEIERICAANHARLEEVRELVFTRLEEPQETAALVQHVAEHFGLRLRNATAVFLTRTPVLAALSSLERAGHVKPVVRGNRLQWKRAG
jgi:glyoxylase-like metal-dependent hydrolase (beta-lactamase superfamily II)